MRGWIATPLGGVYVVAGERGLVSSELAFSKRPETPGRGKTFFEQFAGELERYFAGEAVVFGTLLDTTGLSEDRAQVYRFVRTIPHGSTTSYGAVGRAVGLSARAVGAAMYSCPFFLAVPAQRVIYASGELGGFAGQEGLKRQLLEHEGFAGS